MKKNFLFTQWLCCLAVLLLLGSDVLAQWSTTSVSQSRNNLAGASAGGKALFAGGYAGLTPSDRVDIYTFANSSWTEGTLTQKRANLTAAASGDSVFFAGGNLALGFSGRVDIYIASTNSWAQTDLSVNRSSLASAQAGRKVLFAGGLRSTGPVSTGTTDVIDVYDLIDKNWSTASLSQARSHLAGVAANGKIFFAGGFRSAVNGYSSRVDIYDVANNSWTQESLSQARSDLAAVAAGGKVFFAGGFRGLISGYSDQVDIYDLATSSWSTATLSKKRSNLTATTVGDKVFFAGGDMGAISGNSTIVDIFDLTTQSWSTADLSKKRKDLAAASVGNKALFAAGYVGIVDGGSTVTVDVFTGTTIDQQPTPASSTVCQGENVSSTVTALGENLTYQWYKGAANTSNPVSDQMSATLSLSAVQTSDAGSYYCQVTGTGGVAWSDAYVLTVKELPSAPSITMSGQSNISVIQETPMVSLTITGCESGSIAWSGTDGSSGNNRSISVGTGTVTTIVYSATCTSNGCTSSPGSATVAVTAGTASGSFDGFIYGADCSTFRGWAWDRNKPNTPITVQILDGPNVIHTMSANTFRQDLKDAGKGNGNHAFIFTIPEELKDNQSHTLYARIENGTFYMKGSPKALICQPSNQNPGNTPPKPPTPTVIIAPLAAQIDVPFSATLVAFTDPEGTPMVYDLIGLPNGLTINMTTRVITGTPTESGTFVLTYKATDENGTGASNSVSFNLTVLPASTGVVTGSFEGYLDKVECGTIRGWVWDRKKPNEPVTVEFYTGSTVWGSTVANIYRVDLKDAGKGNGVHAYSFTVPQELKDGQNREIHARVLGSEFNLKGSGKMLQCNAPNRLSAEVAPVLQVSVLGNPVKDQVEFEVRGAEGQSLQFSLTDSQGRLLQGSQVEKAAAVHRHRFTLSGQVQGLLFLNVSGAGQTKSVKVLKF